MWEYCVLHVLVERKTNPESVQQIITLKSATKDGVDQSTVDLNYQLIPDTEEVKSSLREILDEFENALYRAFYELGEDGWEMLQVTRTPKKYEFLINKNFHFKRHKLK